MGVCACKCFQQLTPPPTPPKKNKKYGIWDDENYVHRRQYSSEPVAQMIDSGNQGVVGTNGEQTA